jgi:hypothetical protein
LKLYPDFRAETSVLWALYDYPQFHHFGPLLFLWASRPCGNSYSRNTVRLSIVQGFWLAADRPTQHHVRVAVIGSRIVPDDRLRAMIEGR